MWLDGECRYCTGEICGLDGECRYCTGEICGWMVSVGIVLGRYVVGW